MHKPKTQNWLRGAVAAGLMLAGLQAHAVVSAGDPGDWILAPGALDGRFDGVAQLLYTNSGGAWACSGTLLAGGAYVATAAHCATSFDTMTVKFREGEVVRSVSQAFVLPQWSGINGTGTDIALLQLDQAVTGIQGFRIGTQSALYSEYLLAGYGYVGTGSVGGDTYNAAGRLHYGYNEWDTTDDRLNLSVFGSDYGTSHGVTYVSDFDNGSNWNNTLQQEVGYGSQDPSSTGLGAREGFITGGDSGGGNFVQLSNGEWVLAAVHNTGWVICGCFDANSSWYGSFGELNTATATYSHQAWIASIAGNQVLAAVPEPGSAALLALGGGLLGWRARRRRPD